MQRKTPNISYTVRHDLCVGCGVCTDVCPQKAIKINDTHGLFRPVVDADLCFNNQGCHRCLDICPGIGINIKCLSENLFDANEAVVNPYIGHYLDCYTGHSCNDSIRYHCASGGLTSQMLIYLLEKGFITGAVVTRFDNSPPLMVRTFIARNREEILSAKSSKYAPVTMAGIVDEIKASDGKVAIVGLPCHIQGFRKLEQKDKKFKEHVFAYFGLYCSCGRSFYLTEYVLKKYGIERFHLKHFAYRDNGCMGNLHIQMNEKFHIGNADSISEMGFGFIQIPYQKYYLSLRSFFNVHRCLFCVDHFAELADISFGDIHYGKYIQDKIGINSVVVRRSDLLQLLHEAKSEGFITLEDVSIADLLASQVYVKTKKHLNPMFIKLYRMTGHKVPEYNTNFKYYPTTKAIKSLFVKKVQMLIGGHKFLWPFIKMMIKRYDK